MDKNYLEWCEIMHQRPNNRDQMVFMAGATFYSLDQKTAINSGYGNSELYKCPYEEACKCNMEDSCKGCETWAENFTK